MDASSTSSAEVLNPSSEAQRRLRHELHDGAKVERAVFIRRPVDDVYRFWQDYSNLPLFMKHVDDVERLSPTRSRWTYLVGPGIKLQWDAEILAQTANRVISWQTLPGSSISFAGSVWFHPQTDGTEVRVIFIYNFDSTGRFGRLWQRWGAKVAAAFGADPARILEEDLRQLKAQLESAAH